ncbi:MAG: hypothetical protein ACRC33_08940 [Gemmataceae bacterium]
MNMWRISVMAFALAAGAGRTQPGGKPGLSFDPTDPVILLSDNPAARAEVRLEGDQLRDIRALRDKPGDPAAGERLVAILKPPQRKRLQEVRLQLRGGSALSLPEVADRLRLTAEQKAAVATSMDKAVKKIESGLRSIRFRTDPDRRAYIVRNLREAGGPMLEALTPDQKEAFRALLGPKFDIEKVFKAD